MVEGCLRSFQFRKELGRPSLLRSADVTSKAKGWSSLPVMKFESADQGRSALPGDGPALAAPTRSGASFEGRVI